jgi:sugar phosphate isomerase/epimerase
MTMKHLLPTRRQFLERAASAAAWAALPLSAFAAAENVSLGFSLYGMKTLPLDQALRACAEIGYRNVELTADPGFSAEPKLLSAEDRKNLRAQLASLKLEVSCLMVNLKLLADDQKHTENLQTIKAAAELGHDLVPERPPMIETVLGGKPGEWNQAKDRLAARLLDWSHAASAGNTILAIKAHVGSTVNSPERLLWLLKKVNSPAIAALYDYSHFEVMGFPLADSLKTLLPYTRMIHVKDTSGDEKKFQFLLPGEGRTDYVAYFKLLKQLGFKGPVVAEVSSQVWKKPGYDPIAAATKCYQALSSALAKA